MSDYHYDGIDKFNRPFVWRWVITQAMEKSETVEKHFPELKRELAFPMQGRCTYATQEEAQKQLDAILANNSESTLAMFRAPLGIQKIHCFPVHFDPMGRYFKEPNALSS